MAPLKRGVGWVAPFPKDKKFAFVDDTGDEEVEREATGIHVASNGHGGVRLNYAGADAALMYFDLPSDPALLKEVAQAIRAYALELEGKK